METRNFQLTFINVWPSEYNEYDCETSETYLPIYIGKISLKLPVKPIVSVARIRERIIAAEVVTRLGVL